MKRLTKIGVFFMLILVSTWLCPNGLVAEQNSKNAAMYNLKASFPDVFAHAEGEYITRLYGVPFGYGSSPENTADQFRMGYSEVFGVSSGDLKSMSNLADRRHTQPLMYNRETGQYKFTLVYYTQYCEDIPVFRTDLRLLVRNEQGYPLVLASSALRDLGDFEITGHASVNTALAQDAARSFDADLINFTEPHLVIWAGINDEVVEPAVAMEIIADNGLRVTIDYKKWLFLVDALTGEILYSEDLILNVDVTGNVSGMATQGFGADFCGPEEVTPMPYARVSIGSNFAYADTNGDFIVSNDDSLNVTVTSEIRGRWFRVFNEYGPNSVLSDTVTPPGPIDFIHNLENDNEFNRAEVNGYVQANIVRDFTIKYNPNYNGLDQNEFPVNVNLSDNCNAYYDYSSINFFTSGGGCSNTAFSTVIHHEYGHHLVAMGGSGQGQYGEGMSDIMGILITDDPGLAYGFFGDCFEYMRTGDNGLQYPCDGAIHYCGQLLSGCVWSTRNELIINYPDEYIDILSNLAINAIFLHHGDMITPSITIDYLTLDDDDGNIYNGTPHYPEICAGFGDHNMDCPELRLIGFDYPDGHPELINPDGGTIIEVEVYSITENPEPGTGRFYYNTGSGWIDTAMQEISANSYEAVFPEIECGLEVLFYFSAETDEGTLVTNPSDAPSTVYTSFSAYDLITIFEDDFETNQGWTVEDSPGLTAGSWERGIPVGGGERGDPPTDYDESGNCYLTENIYGNSDVDDGTTYLISPAIDLEENIAIIYYALWYTNYFGNDPNNDLFEVWISDNNGDDWTHVETFGPYTSNGWTEHSFLVNDFVTPSNQVKIRFEASDLSDGSVVEAGIDAFRVMVADCEPTHVADEIKIANIPSDYTLIGCYPNPFNAQTIIEYGLPEASYVFVDIYDLLGRRVETLVNKEQPAGYHHAVWNAASKSSGMYFYRFRANDFSETKRMILLK